MAPDTLPLTSELSLHFVDDQSRLHLLAGAGVSAGSLPHGVRGLSLQLGAVGVAGSSPDHTVNLFLDGYWFHVFEDKVCVLLDLALGLGLYQSGGQETEEDNLQAKHINGLRETAGISCSL